MATRRRCFEAQIRAPDRSARRPQRFRAFCKMRNTGKCARKMENGRRDGEARRMCARRSQSLACDVGFWLFFDLSHHLKSRGLKQAEQRLVCERTGIAESRFAFILYFNSVI